MGYFIREEISSIDALARDMLSESLSHGDVAVDANVGYGEQTVFLADLVGGSGVVIGLESDECIFNVAVNSLGAAGVLNRVQLWRSGYEHLKQLRREDWNNNVQAIWLDRSRSELSVRGIVTHEDCAAVLKGINASLHLLAPGGKLFIKLNPEATLLAEDAKMIKSWSSTLPSRLFDAELFTNESDFEDSEELLVIEKL